MRKSQKYVYLVYLAYCIVKYNYVGVNYDDDVNGDKNAYLTIGLIIFIFIKYTTNCRNTIFQVIIISYFYSGT